MRFRDRKHQLAVQNAEKTDAAAQQLIAEFCELINFPYQQQQGLFAVGFYQSVLPVAPARASVVDEGVAVEDIEGDAAQSGHDTGGAGLRRVGDEPAADEGADVSKNGEDNTLGT
jgi:hypothetical protein